MAKLKTVKNIVGIFAVVFSGTGLAMTNSPFYVAVDAGIFQGSMSQKYLDQTDIIQQNIAESLQQYGYTEGVAVGYSKLWCHQYLLGAELSGNIDSHSANYQSGAASTAFSDVTQINNHVDLAFVPGILLGDTVAAYAKLGISFASVQDSLFSPVGYTPVITRFQTNKNVTGFAGGLGLKKFITEKVSVFTEANYHDYGTVNFSNFQNFTANYTHSAHLYSYDVVLGAAYYL